LELIFRIYPTGHVEPGLLFNTPNLIALTIDFQYLYHSHRANLVHLVNLSDPSLNNSPLTSNHLTGLTLSTLIQIVNQFGHVDIFGSIHEGSVGVRRTEKKSMRLGEKDGERNGYVLGQVWRLGLIVEGSTSGVDTILWYAFARRSWWPGKIYVMEG